RSAPGMTSIAMTRLSALLARLFDFLAVMAALILLAMVVVVTADIVLRNTVRTGLAWSNEATEYALYLITLLTAPWLLRRGQHVRIDIVLVIVPPRLAWLLEAPAHPLGPARLPGLREAPAVRIGLAASLMLVWYGTVMTVQSARLGALTIKNLVFP